jgi:hypothetical protein
LKARAIALPLFTLAVSCVLVGQQYARRNRYIRELNEAQIEYTRLSKQTPSVPASASSLFAESKEHNHSEDEEAHAHAEAKPSAPSIH